MSEVLGIIAEYDPFHNGHRYLLEEAKRSISPDVSVAVISGDFTQRGEPALIDKWARAEMAVRQGIDLVVEMPFVFACNNAGYFGRAGVEILEALGTTRIAFGSETGDLDLLQRAASGRASMTAEQHEEIKDLVKEGLSYPRAVSAVLGDDEGLGPNDNLAVEYLIHMAKAEPLAIVRRGAAHDSLDRYEGVGEYGNLDEYAGEGTIASATFIRRKLLEGEPLKSIRNLVPFSTLDVLKREFEASGFCSPDMLFKQIVSRVAQVSADELNYVYGAEEGLGSKLKEEFRYATQWDGLIWVLKSKRYTRTRIQRVLTHMLTGLTREMVHEAKPYIRPLAFNKRGATHLKSIKKSGNMTLPMIENISTDLKEHPELKATFDMEILATDLYNAALERDLYTNSEYVKKPLIF